MKTAGRRLPTLTSGGWRAVFVASAVALATALLVLAYWRWGSAFSPSALKAFVLRSGAWGPVVFIVAHVFQILVAPIPGHALPLVAGLVYGVFWGTLLDFVGITLGSLASFALGRVFGKPLVRKLVGERRMLSVERRLAGKGALGLALLFVLPVPGMPKDALCFGAATVGFTWRRFLVAFALGRLPVEVVMVTVGAGLALNWHTGVALLVGLTLLYTALFFLSKRLRWSAQPS